MDICTLSALLGSFTLYGTARSIIPMPAVVISSKRVRSLRQRWQNDKPTPSCVSTYGNALGCLGAMAKMPCSWRCSPTMSVWVVCLATANRAKASYFVRLSKGIGISRRNIYPFVTTKTRSCVGYLDAGRQNLLCSIYHRWKTFYFSL